MTRPWKAVSLLATLALLNSCLTIDLAGGGAPLPPAGTVVVETFRSASALRQGRRFEGDVRSRLIRLGEGAGEKVFESDQPTWTVTGLAPGTYRLEVLSWADRDGRARHDELESGEFELPVRSGARVELVLRDGRGAFWGSASSLVLVGLVLGFSTRL